MLLYFLFIGTTLAFVIRILLTAFKPGLREIPGPWLAKFTDLWRTYHAWKGDNIDAIRRAHAKYGNLIRIGPNCILLSEDGQFEKILGFKQDFIKSDSMKVWQTINDGKPTQSIATTQDKKIHAELKRPIASIYSMTNTMTFEPKVDNTIRYFLKRLDEAFISGDNKGKKCDIDNWVQYFAFDVVGEITLSQHFGFLEHGGDIDGMLADLHTEFNYRGTVQNMPWLDSWLAKNPLYLWFSTPSNKFIARAKGLIMQRVGQLRKEKSTAAADTEASHPDFVTRFLEAQQQHPSIVTPQVLAGYVASNFFAGSDTTGIVMRSILYYVHRTPGVLAKLRQELDDARVTYPVPYSVAKDLKYLDAVIRESMRIHFIGSIFLERVVPETGYTLPSGKELPAGTVLALNPWTLNFRKHIYGDDAEVFRPERWLPAEGESEEMFEERLAVMKHNDFSFSYGPRACLGRHIATLEIWKVMPTLLGLLDMKFANPEKEWRVEGAFFARQYEMDMFLDWREGVEKEKYVNL